MKTLFAVLAALMVLFCSTAPVQAQTSCFGETYVIQPGDTLSSIAERCRLSFPGLIGINVEIEDPDLIRPGQVIRLQASVPLYTAPAGGPPLKGGLQENGQVYIVRPGDSLARIAYLYHTTVPELLRFNPEIRPDLAIQAGQRIQMPPDARRERGWVGISTHVASPGDEFEVRVVDFPPYADIDVRVGEVFAREEGDIEVYYYLTLDARTDSRGQARVTVKLPNYAWIDEEWVVEVVTTEYTPVIQALSPVILIDYY